MAESSITPAMLQQWIAQQQAKKMMLAQVQGQAPGGDLSMSLAQDPGQLLLDNPFGFWGQYDASPAIRDDGSIRSLGGQINPPSPSPETNIWPDMRPPQQPMSLLDMMGGSQAASQAPQGLLDMMGGSQVKPTPTSLLDAMGGSQAPQYQSLPPPPMAMLAQQAPTPAGVPSFRRKAPTPAGVPSFRKLQPLKTEDGDNGYWDAKTMGNGRGRSFIVQNGVRTFVSDEEMRRIKAGGSPSVSAYAVKKGDTMTKIARLHGMTLDELKRKNPQIKNADRIYVGDKINL